MPFLLPNQQHQSAEGKIKIAKCGTWKESIGEICSRLPAVGARSPEPAIRLGGGFFLAEDRSSVLADWELPRDGLALVVVVAAVVVVVVVVVVVSSSSSGSSDVMLGPSPSSSTVS